MAEIGILSRTKRVSAQERLAHIHDVKARTIGVRHPTRRMRVQHPIATVRVPLVGAGDEQRERVACLPPERESSAILGQ
jgi:hypothetical protein